MDIQKKDNIDMVLDQAMKSLSKDTSFVKVINWDKYQNMNLFENAFVCN